MVAIYHNEKTMLFQYKIFAIYILNLCILCAKAKDDTSQYTFNNSLQYLKNDSTFKKNDSIQISDKITNKSDVFLSDLKFDKPKIRYSNDFNKLFSISGNLTIETFGANAQNPLAMNELFYTRVWMSPRLTIMGLPFTTDIYYTSENNSLYNSNSFNLNFDAATFKRQLLDGLLKEVNERKKTDQMRQRDLDLKKKQEVELNKKGTLLDAEISKLDKELAELNAKRTINFDPNIDQNINLPKDSINLLLGDSSNIFKNSINSDSINKRYEKAKVRKEKLEADKIYIEEKIYAIQKKKEEIEALRQRDSSLVNIDESEFYKKRTLKSLTRGYNSKFKKVLGFASGFDKFNVGVVYPTHSDFTVVGTPVKGADIAWSSDKFFINITAGKAAANDFRFFSTERPEFDRNFYAITTGLGNKEKSHIYISRSYFDDPDIIMNRQRINNSVNSIGAKGLFYKNKITLSAEIAQSDFRAQNSAINETLIGISIDTINRIQPAYKLSNLNTALWMEGNYKVLENLEIHGKVQRVNPGFKSIGNPFMRVGFFESDFSLKGSFLKKKISTQVFYKVNSDNLANENSSTNKMSGYGIMLQSNLNKKYPNVSVYHSPYQHGNNHPDSLLRSFNQFSITNLTLTYSKQIKKVFLVTSTSFSQSVMSLDKLGKTGMRSFIMNTSAVFAKGLQSSFVWQKNTTNPGIDTLNANLFSLTLSKNLNPKFTLGGETHLTWFKNGAEKNGAKIMFMYKPSKKLSFSLIAGYDYIDKLWGFDKKNVYNGRLKINVFW